MVSEGTAEHDPFIASEGLLLKFLKRHDLTMRKSTTVCQKTPGAYMSKLIKFPCFVRQRCGDLKLEDNMIIACDEYPIWYDNISNSTVEKIGCKEVSVRSIGHTKIPLTVLLSAMDDGTKLKPYILLARKRHVPELVKKFGSKAILVFQGTNGMNQAIMEDYLDRVIGYGTASSVILARTQKILFKKLKVDQAVIPGGCTCFISGPDVCWNKPVFDLKQSVFTDNLQQQAILNLHLWR